jgi:hypothetical protein
VADEAAIGERYRALAGEFDDRRRRLWAAAETRSVGGGGVAAVARATGIAENTIRRGLRDLGSGERLGLERVRRPGAGRKRLVEVDPSLLVDLALLVDEECRGDPESPLRWLRRASGGCATSCGRGREVSHETIAQLLRALGFSLQANRKVREGASHSDRDAQFHSSTRPPGPRSTPVSRWSVDIKKKELIANLKSSGREWRPEGEPELV